MSEVQRGSKGHRRYRMDYIPDKDLFRAVTFARSMISDGTSPGRAFRVAANYYGVDRNEVAHFAAQYAGSMGGKASAGNRACAVRAIRWLPDVQIWGKQRRPAATMDVHQGQPSAASVR